MNRLIPPPMDVLKEWLSETHRRLTTIDNDLTAVPTLSRELEAFRRFFEIQASILKKGRIGNSTLRIRRESQGNERCYDKA